MKAWKKGVIAGILVMLVSIILGSILPIQEIKRIFLLIGLFPLLIIYYTTGYEGSGTDIPIITPLLLIISWSLMGATISYLIDKYKSKK